MIFIYNVTGRQNSDDEVWMYEIVEGRHVWPGFKIHWWENPIFW